MKNLIEYYYGIYINHIKKINNKYYIDSGYDKYIFTKVDKNTYISDNLYDFNMLLLDYNSLFHRIIINKDNLVTTTNNNNKYILLKINISNNRLITTNDILNLSIPIIINNKYLETLNYSNWTYLWKEKINYFEYYSDTINTKNLFLKELMNYYLGLAENAISYVENTLRESNIINNNLVISHKRIKYNYTLEDLYNPLEIILDNRVRDISEYFKDMIIKGKASEEWLEENFDNCNFDRIESRLLFGRMLFPSFFFDRYEFFVNKKIDEKTLLNIINEIEIYENSLKNLYRIINSRYHIPGIKWLDSN